MRRKKQIYNMKNARARGDNRSLKNAVETESQWLFDKELPSDAGWVYVMSNNSMQGIVKVGMTNKTPALRANELSRSTAIPSIFKVEYAAMVQKPIPLEKEAHCKLIAMHHGKEFFECDVQLAVDIIEELASDIITVIDNGGYSDLEAIEAAHKLTKKAKVVSRLLYVEERKLLRLNETMEGQHEKAMNSQGEDDESEEWERFKALEQDEILIRASIDKSLLWLADNAPEKYKRMLLEFKHGLHARRIGPTESRPNLRFGEYSSADAITKRGLKAPQHLIVKKEAQAKENTKRTELAKIKTERIPVADESVHTNQVKCMEALGKRQSTDKIEHDAGELAERLVQAKGARPALCYRVIEFILDKTASEYGVMAPFVGAVIGGIIGGNGAPARIGGVVGTLFLLYAIYYKFNKS